MGDQHCQALMDQSAVQVRTSGRLSKMQGAVEQAFGRCVLQVQSYELTAKRVLSAAQVQVEAVPAALVRPMTLGGLAGQMTETFLVPMGQEQAMPEPDAAWSVRFRIGVPKEDLARIKADLRDLVTMRNQMVHHFLEQHHLGSVADCQTALAALAKVSTRVQTARAELQTWVKDLARMQAQMAEVLADPEVLAKLTRTEHFS